MSTTDQQNINQAIEINIETIDYDKVTFHIFKLCCEKQYLSIICALIDNKIINFCMCNDAMEELISKKINDTVIYLLDKFQNFVTEEIFINWLSYSEIHLNFIILHHMFDKFPKYTPKYFVRYIRTTHDLEKIRYHIEKNPDLIKWYNENDIVMEVCDCETEILSYIIIKAVEYGLMLIL